MLSQKTKNCRDLAGSKSQAGWAFIWWDFRIKFMQISGRALEGSRDMVSLMRKVTQNCKVLTFFAYDANFCVCLMCVCVLSHIQLFATPWTVAHQVPLSMEFSRQEYWTGSPFHTPGGLPGPGMEPTSLASSALAGRFFITVPPGKLLLTDVWV